MKKLIIAGALLLAGITTLIAPAAPAFASTTAASSITPITLSEVQTDASGNKYRTISSVESTSSTSAGTQASSTWQVKVSQYFTNIMYLKNNTILLFGNVPATDTVAGYAILALYSATTHAQIGTTLELTAGTILDEVLLDYDNSSFFALKRTVCENAADRTKSECRVLYKYEANTKSGLISKWHIGIPTADLSSLNIAASATLKLSFSASVSNMITLQHDGSALAYFKITDGTYYNANWNLTCEAAADKKFSVTLPKISALVDKTATIKSISLNGKTIASANYKLGSLSTGLITFINSALAFDAKTEHRLEITLSNGEKYLTTFTLGGTTKCTAATDATTQNENNTSTTSNTNTGNSNTSTSVSGGSSSSSSSSSTSSSTSTNTSANTSTNTSSDAELPKTGPTTALLSVLGLAALGAATAYYLNSRKNHTATIKLPTAAGITAKFEKIPETIYNLLDKIIK
jgi:hypothetical protein